jgi:hypothetical protein
VKWIVCVEKPPHNGVGGKRKALNKAKKESFVFPQAMRRKRKARGGKIYKTFSPSHWDFFFCHLEFSSWKWVFGVAATRLASSLSLPPLPLSLSLIIRHH